MCAETVEPDDEPGSTPSDGRTGIGGDAAAVRERLPVAIWGEIGIVVLFGVLGPFGSAVGSLIWPTIAEAQAKSTFVEDAYWSIHNSGVVAVLMVYLLWRSAEPWSQWGIVRFVWSRDIPLGFLLWISAWFMQDVFVIFLRRHISFAANTLVWPIPQSKLDFALLISMSCVNGFSEEVIMRGYLIPRLERAFHSTIFAVVATSIMFASYHIYQGASATASILMFGLVYGAVFAWLRRLWPLAIAHALADLVAIGNF